MSEGFWKRVGDGVYELRGEDGSVLAIVKRYDPPTNSNFSIWAIEGVTGHFPTLRDAKHHAEKAIA